jgi:hypothetical protein
MIESMSDWKEDDVSQQINLDSIELSNYVLVLLILALD